MAIAPQPRLYGASMKKFLLILIVFIVLLFVGGIMVVDFALERASDKALEYLAAEGASRGIKVEFARFESVGLSGLGVVQWKDFTAAVNAPQYISFAPGEDVVISIREINLDLMRLPKGVAAITAHDIGVRVKNNPSSADRFGEQTEGIEQGQLKAELPLDFTDRGNFAASLVEMPNKVFQFLQEGKTPIPFGFRAKSALKIDGSVMGADITTRRKDGYFFLVMSADDLQKIAAMLKEDLTEEEIRLLSLNPLRAQAIFAITKHARTQSEVAYAKDATVPEDAYRHVLWSFMLTKQFGPEFAKQVTDAHEIGSVTHNTEADHRMDYNNNEVGREYAKKGYAEGQILQMVLTDPQVIKVAQP
jgi:hypothetical protein